MRRWILVLVLLVTSAPAAWAQQTPPASSTREQKWEIEVFGGLPVGRFTSGGALTLPSPGAPITTSSPVFPSWRVPSWFFGDGASFLNNVASEFGMTNRLAPLDELFETTSGRHRQRGAFGLRVRRALKGTYALEIGVEFVARPSSGSSGSTELADAARSYADSYTATFQELLSRPPFTLPAVSVQVTAAEYSARETLVTAALNADSKRVRGFVPYATVGAGVSIPSDGPQSSLILAGQYTFRVNNVFPFDETDWVEIGFAEKTVFVGVLGGGLRWELTPSLGIRADGRFLMGPNPTTVTVTALPNVATAAQPASTAFIESFTYPNLQFSNNPSTGRVSTLGGPELREFEVFKGGWLTRGRFTAGVFVRF